MTGSRLPFRVGVVGLGTISAVHLTVLGSREDTDVVLGVDPRSGTRPDAPFPRFGSLEEALHEGPRIDCVVVATPTDSHVAVVHQALTAGVPLVLSEKPLTRRPAEAAALMARFADAAERVRVAHHFAFSPEVEWASSTAASWASKGPPTSLTSVFNDPYLAKSPEERVSYVSPWVDSGPNQLSMLRRFVGPFEPLSHSTSGTSEVRSLTRLAYDGGEALLVGNWSAGASSKHTTLRYADGSELHLDHTAMTAVARGADGIDGHFVTDGRTDRKLAHYANLYDHLLAPDPGPVVSFGMAVEVAEVLHAAEQPEVRGAAGFAGP